MQAKVGIPGRCNNNFTLNLHELDEFIITFEAQSCWNVNRGTD